MSEYQELKDRITELEKENYKLQLELIALRFSIRMYNEGRNSPDRPCFPDIDVDFPITKRQVYTFGGRAVPGVYYDEESGGTLYVD